MLVIGIIEGKIIIDYLIEIVLSVDGDKVFDVFCDLIWIVVVEWYGVNGNIVIGFVKGFGFKWGVIVLIVCYDYYNIVVVGVDYVDMVIVVNCLSEIEGGFVVVQDGQVMVEFVLFVVGLMLLDLFEIVCDQLIDLWVVV